MAVGSAPVNRLDQARRFLAGTVLPGAIGSLAVVAVPVSLALLAFAPLGVQAPQPALAAAAGSAALGSLVYAWLSRAALPAGGPSSATTLVLAALIAQLCADPLVLDGSAEGPKRVVAACSAAVALSGGLQVLIARAGLARLARMVPRPVLGGFMNGVALLILLGQLPLLLGVAPGMPLSRLAALAQPLALVFGLGTLALIVALERWRPRWPALLVVLATGTALHLLVSTLWPQAAIGERVGLWRPPWPDLAALLQWAPALGLDRLAPHTTAVLTTAAVIALVGALESLLGLLALDEQLQSRHDPRHELQALGWSNVAGGLLGALPLVFLRARALAVMRAGASSRLAAGAGAVAMALLFYAATPVLGALPLPVLGGIMVAIAISLVDRWTTDMLRRWWRGEGSADLRTGLLVMAAVCAVTLWQGFAAGVALGLLLSMLVLIVRMNRSLLRSEGTAARRPSRRLYPAAVEAELARLRASILVWELEGALFFGNADRLLARAETWPPAARVLVLDLHRVSSVDETGASALAKLSELLRRRQVKLLLSGIEPGSTIEHALDAYGVAAPRQPDIDRATEAAETHVLGKIAHITMVGVPLEGSDLLRGLDAAQKAVVSALMTPRRLAPDEVLFRQGDAADGLYVVSKGSVSLIGSDGQHSQRYLSVSPGMMLGETAMLDGGGRSADAVADTAGMLHHLATDALQQLERSHPEIALQLHRNMAVYLSGRLRSASAAWWSEVH